jgi:hypothetical protein
VKWPNIAAAKLIVELSMPGNTIEPSQGTHFFQNLTSFGVGYFTVGTSGDDSIFDIDWLKSLPTTYDSENVTIVRFNAPLKVSINGQKGLGVVLKPESE